MSKIYEALKKSHAERSQPRPVVEPPIPHESGPAAVQEPTPPTAVQEHVPMPVLPAAPSVSPTRTHINFSGQYLRFEDLLKQCAQPVWQLDPNGIVFSNAFTAAQGAEQFRTLRTRLYQIRDVSPLKKILVTSAMAAEGKTFVTTNLAQAFACERGRKVLIIDGDMRSARLHLPLGAPVSPGLAEYLREEASEAEIIQHGQEGNLCLIAGGEGGGKNASELLSNGRLQKLLDRVTPLFDWVIIDSPPCLPVSDASILAGFCDGLLLVAKASSTPSAAVLRARQELSKRNLIGVVLNAAEESDAYGGYYAYSYGDNGSKSGSKKGS